jgi:hypothetical protein
MTDKLTAKEILSAPELDDLQFYILNSNEISQIK